jgi:hypothetical protein
MSCCGEPKVNAPANREPQSQQPTRPIVTQPNFQPGLEKPQFFQQPSISPPPAVYANAFTANGLQQPGQPAWGQSPSPPLANDFGTLTNSPMPSTTPTFNGSTYNGSTFNVSSGFSSMSQPLMRPTSAHSRHMSDSTPPLMGQAGPAQDEGKMSISIDFGAHISHYAHSYSHFAFRYHFLWCCK